jgi:hypothetical protein
MLLALPLVCAVAARAAPPGGERPCAVSLANGDQLRGRPESIAGGRLVLRPEVAPQSVITLDLENVRQMTFDRGEAKPAQAAEVLRLRDGSVLVGKFARLADKAIEFDLAGTGPVEIPRDAVEALSRPRRDGGSERGDARQGSHTLCTVAGDTLLGSLEQEPGGLLAVRSGAIEARVAVGNVRTILFPLAEGADQPKTAKRLLATLTTREGISMVGQDVRLDGGRFSLTIVGGRRIDVPIERVVQAAFSTEEGIAPRRSVLVWGAFSDRAEEHPRTMNVLKEGLPSGWQVTENFSEKFDDDFRRALRLAGVLVISEMDEHWGPQAETLALELKGLAETFLRRGGTIIILSAMERQHRWLAEADLLDVTVASSNDGADIPFTEAGRRIAEGVGPSFRTTNSTQFYRLGTRLKADALAGNETGSPIVLRRVGPGRIFLLGMDYYESNDQTRRILVNAAMSR